ncbi:MAG: ImmA/IrrE family metallo-endopeptidase [Aquificaceae bacterium]
MVEWAINRIGETPEKVAKSIGIKTPRFKSLLEGKGHITYNQLHKLAHALHIPYGYLFLSEVPEEKSEIPDLRKIKDSKPLSWKFFEVYSDIKIKQEWIKEKRLSEGYTPLKFVGKYSIDTPHQVIAKDIKETLNLNHLDNINELVDRVESIGILVFRNSVLINNTHIELDPEEFRGFSIVDEIAPVIFINSNDTQKAQIFTLFHEIAHIWVGQSGVSDADPENQNAVERLCNMVAIEILAPELEIKSRWNENISPLENIQNLSKIFPVSKTALLYRLLNLRMIDREEYELLKAEMLKKTYELELRNKEQKGGDYYKLLLSRNSKTFIYEVIDSLLNQEITYLSAMRLLNIKKDKILIKLMEELGV